MKKESIILTLLIIAFFYYGCYNENSLSSTEEIEKIYSGEHTLPQGNHDYDKLITELFDKYNSMFLYKYTPHDIYYNVTSYLAGIYDSENNYTRSGYFYVPADEEYIGHQLQLLKEIWLDVYPEEFLKISLPIKVFLVDSFYHTYDGVGRPQEIINKTYTAFRGSDNLIVTFASKRILEITNSEKNNFKSELNSFFLMYATSKGFLEIIEEFAEITDYSDVPFSTYYNVGALDYVDRLEGGLYTVNTDWRLYLTAIVSNSYEMLNLQGGILHPDTDVNGLIRKKYDIIINYFINQFNIDLQAIGNIQY